jgi:hypothetical protein
MFFRGSRYENAGTYHIRKPDGTVVAVTRLHSPSPTPPAGYYRHLEGQRLDQIAAGYLGDATAFWRLCDANNVVVPDALAARDLIGIPPEGA